MKLRLEHLNAHLDKDLAAIYVVHGDELLLVQEAVDAIRNAARARGYTERAWLTVEAGFDWDILPRTSASLSLFASRRILELRLGNAKPGDAGTNVLHAYAHRPSRDVLLVVTCAKLDPATQKGRWFTALETAGIAVQVWPVDAVQLPAWIERRLRYKGLQATAEAVTLLAERVEGNLLAAAQEIEKLYMLFGAGSITARQVQTLVNDSARYNVYDLVDAALAGQAERAVRILQGLRNEGQEAPLISWALHREIRLLNLLSFALSQGQPLEMALTNHRVWEKRKPLLRRALLRLPVSTCRCLLEDCARLDRLIKGIEPGDHWDALAQLSLRLAGREMLNYSALAS